jgi:TRAP-type mannitol/chloroaromatic compound transport system permease large subunit
MKAGNLLGGFAVAVVLSATFIVPSVGGIATWKIIMGMAGLWIFIRAGMSR